MVNHAHRCHLAGHSETTQPRPPAAATQILAGRPSGRRPPNFTRPAVKSEITFRIFQIFSDFAYFSVEIFYRDNFIYKISRCIHVKTVKNGSF